MSWKIRDANGAYKTALSSIASSDLTIPLTSPPPIGTTTPNTGYFSALRLKIGGFFAIFTHSNTADHTYTLPDYDGTLATRAGTETFTNKTHTAPVISGGSANNMSVGLTTQAGGYFSALRLIISSFAAIFTHANSADRTYTLPDASVTLVGDTNTQTVTNKTFNSSDIGGTTPGLGYFNALRLKLGGFFAIFTHAMTADRTITFQDASGTVQLNADGNFIPNSSFEGWENSTSLAPGGWVLTGASATVAQEATLIKHGDYSAKVTRVGNDCHLSADIYALGGKTYMRSRTYTVKAWVYATVPSRVRLRVNDGTTTTNSSYHSGGSGWEELTVTFTVNSGATALNVGLAVDTGNTSGYMDGVTIAEGLSAPNYTNPIKSFNDFPHVAVFNGHQISQPNGAAGLTIATNTSQLFNGWITQTTSANGDSFSTDIWLKAGTYTLSHLGVTGPAGAILTWSIDGVNQAALTNIDYYTVGAVFNVLKTGAVTVLFDGFHRVKATVTGRNGSNSTGYNWYITQVIIN